MKGLPATPLNICLTAGPLPELTKRMWYVPVLHSHLTLSHCYCSNLFVLDMGTKCLCPSVHGKVPVPIGM